MKSQPECSRCVHTSRVVKSDTGRGVAREEGASVGENDTPFWGSSVESVTAVAAVYS